MILVRLRRARRTTWRGVWWRVVAATCLVCGFDSGCLCPAATACPATPSLGGEICDPALALLGATPVAWPTAAQWKRTLLLQDYNSRIVVLGATVLGAAAGLVGSFTLLRKRALMGDALSHATLPGICAAFMLATALGYPAKSLPVLLTGATLSGLLGMASILLIRNLTRIKEDAALGIVLSVFFGAGTALRGVVVRTPAGNAAGLEAFIYGKTASMGAQDALLIGVAALLCTAIGAILFKELRLLCFDEVFAGAEGYPVVALDVALMTLVVAVSIVGLQAVGLILMVALLVIPAAAARFWTERMLPMTLWAAALGAISGMVGSTLSAVFSRLPSGAMIVLTSTAFFMVSMAIGARRGVFIRWLRRRRLNQRIGRQHLLRALFEIREASGASLASTSPPSPASFAQVQRMRSWSTPHLQGEIRRAVHDGLVVAPDEQRIELTEAGLLEAAHATRQHRLWELYLIEHADVAPGRVDRDADDIEHVLDPHTVAQLEHLLDADQGDGAIPASPHAIPAPPTPQSAGGAP
ncbi:MAG: metal ABC transporter permease [Planctomycetales bacterium]|nr:metal ABC transporter permease [Planctomycetales bacterium]